MGNFCLKVPSAFAIILMLLLVWALEQESCYAREGKHWRRKTAESHATAVVPQQEDGGSSIFNVLDYGAKGDGHTDDTKAFETAWAAACKIEASRMVVPSGSVFLLKPITFPGSDCKPNIIFQLDGKIIAPTGRDAWGSGLLQWLDFTDLKGITVTGTGITDGQGSVWWNDHSTTQVSSYSSSQDLIGNEEARGNMPSTKPTALRFYGSSGVTVTGITIQESPQTHLKFDSCTNVQVSHVTISSPAGSPNTDGIHLQNSQDVIIYSSSLACGDDCVSIQTGCSGVYMHDLTCGPGHGISIGGLGKDGTRACVSNVTVRDTTIQNTLTGVRIKSWQGGSGLAQGITFSNIQVSDVKTPIMIDQYYCDGSTCQNKTSAVAVSGVSYLNIKGTYTEKPVHFACSDSTPCTGISLATIDLTPTPQVSNLDGPFCWQVYGELRTATTPPIDCLKDGKPSTKQSQSDQTSC